MKGDREVEKMFNAVVADYRKNWRRDGSPARKRRSTTGSRRQSKERSITSSSRRSNSAVSNVAMEDVQEAGDVVQSSTEPSPELVEKQPADKEE